MTTKNRKSFICVHLGGYSMERKSIDTFIQYKKHRFAKVNIFVNEFVTTFVLNLLPGQMMPEHYHLGSQLYFLVIHGSGKFIINGEEVNVAEGDTVHILGTERVGFVNTGDEPANIYVTMCKIDDWHN
jgi:mannose-6-phosphate isomerase-like protein (cupin superfamily)